MTPAPAPAPDPADQLAAAGALRRLATRVERDGVARATDEGWSWVQIAEALGVTKQAVHKRYAKDVGQEE